MILKNFLRQVKKEFKPIKIQKLNKKKYIYLFNDYSFIIYF